MNSCTFGEYVEAAVMCHLLWLGDFVSTPHGNSRPYDLIADRNGRLIRGQVKSAKITPAGSLTFTLTGARGRVLNYRGKADVFWAYAGGQVYEIPVSDVPVGRQRVTVRKELLDDYRLGV